MEERLRRFTAARRPLIVRLPGEKIDSSAAFARVPPPEEGGGWEVERAAANYWSPITESTPASLNACFPAVGSHARCNTDNNAVSRIIILRVARRRERERGRLFLSEAFYYEALNRSSSYLPDDFVGM